MLGKNAERPNSPPFITLGPEWMSKEKNADDENRFAPPTLISSLSSIRNKQIQRENDQNNARKRAPNLEKLGKSKSSPVLIEKKEDSIESKDIFTLVKEKNTFDRNFPTLGARKSKIGAQISPKGTLRSPSPSTPHNNPMSKENSWKQISERASQTQKSPASTPPASASNSGDNLSSIAKLSPCVESKFVHLSPPSSASNKKENASEQTKKSETVQKMTAKRFSLNSFRKASSEPNLPITPMGRENYEMSYQSSNLHYVGEVRNNLNRKDFFMSLMKKEKKEASLDNEVEDGEKGDWFGNYSSSDSLAKQDSEGEMARGSPEMDRAEQFIAESWESHSDIEADQQSLKSFDDQEEVEKFLRNMGWVPEEEDHVPELTEEEINEASSINAF
eukprot:TRINITY_DN130_c0_g4_i1.p1 TRINITY_DN130_c0_g4~~TRINITY_DN130_c0_g4_i1.p1  ORF type:complete len:390 (-),score=157.21 TRINITY_DN130_c0_g4_i1:180-1349(-)